MNIILHCVYIAHFLVVINGQTCEPCEENKPCTISFTSRNVSSSVNQFIWTSDRVTVTVCYSQNGLECLLSPEARGLLLPTIETESDDVVKTYVKFTATRLKKLTSETKWELNVLDAHQGLKLLYTCDVKIYKSVPQPSCTYEASNKGLEVKCFSSFVYPTSVCNFNVRFDQTISKQTALHYNHSITNTDPIYYTTECSLSVPQKLLKPGLLKYQVTMFPNISTSSTTFARNDFEKTAEGTIKIEFPSIKIVACPDIVEVGSIFNCRCERNDQSYIPTVVYWYGSHTTNVLSEIAMENETVYVCKAENNFGWLSTLNYSPRTKVNKSSNELASFSGKPSNSSNECNGDNEVFLKDDVYSCLSPHNGKNLHEWCHSFNVSDNITTESNICHEICVLLNSAAKGQNHKDIDIIFGTVVALLILVIGILICICKKKIESLQQQLKQSDKENE